MRTTKAGRFAALAVGLALVAAACSSDSKSDTTNAPQTTTGGTSTDSTVGDTTAPTDSTPAEGGGTVTYAAEQEFTAYNNATADQVLFANTLVLNMVQPGPYISNPDLTLTPWEDLVSSIEVTSTDPQVVVYKLQPDAVWSDGVAIDCKDFYLAWISENGKDGYPNPDYTDATQVDADGNPVPEELHAFNPAGTTGYEDISSVDCSDGGKTVTTTYSKPFVDYPVLFGGLIPAHIVEEKSGVADVTKATSIDDLKKLGEVWNTGFSGFDASMDLSGAWYTIDSFTPGETLVLKKNDKFWGKPGLVDEIDFRLVADAAEQPSALENGDVQVISPQPNPDLLKQLQGLTGVTTSVEQGVTFEHYDFNEANPFLADVNVRKAFALCIDRQEIVDTLVTPLNPDATVLNNRMYIPASPDYKDNSGDFGKRDVAKAKDLLTQSGFTFNADGIAEKDGKTLTLRLGRRDPNPRRQSTNELVIASCKEAGFDLVDDPAETFNSVRLPASDYDIALFAWVATAAQSSNTSIYVAGGGQNWNSYSNPKIQELFDQANVEFDPAKRADLMNQIDQILWDDMATLPLFQFQELVSYNDSVTGVVYNGPLGVTWNANEWAVKAS